MKGRSCLHRNKSRLTDGQHFQALIVCAEFRGKNRVQRHQRVYQALGERMREEVHALSMQTLTPEEWREQAT